VSLLEIKNLHVDFPTQGAVLHAVEGVTLSLEEGEVLGIVGESGSGKSVTMMALMGLIPYPGRVRADTLRFAGKDLLGISDKERRGLVGKDVAMIFQEPTTSLNPCFTIGFQLMETLKLHLHMDKKAAKKRAIELLEQVGIPAASSRLNEFPHQMSGGMNQRVMIAMAIACNPRLLIADEPTTALDVTIQAQILELIAELRKELGLSVMLITHNLGVVHEIADRVAVMYAGEVVETGTVAEIFSNPRHPYTQGLLRSMPYLIKRQPTLHVIPGRVPELWAMPNACRFAARCPNRTEQCIKDHPALERIEINHELRCFNPTSFVR